MLPRIPATRIPTHAPGIFPLGIVLDSSYFDWQANGSLGRRVWIYVDGSVHVTYMKSADEEFEDRGMHYYYSNERGENFVSHGNVGSFRNGHGSIASYPFTTPEFDPAAIVSAHDYSTSISSAFVDSAQGEGNFSLFAVDDSADALWPKPSVNSDGSITLIGTYPGFINNVIYSVGRAFSPGHSQGFSGGWAWFGSDWDDWKSGDMQWPAVSSGENGRVGVVVPDLAADVHLFESSDAGRSFRGSIITTAVTDTLSLPEDIDTLATIFLPWQNADIVYQSDGSAGSFVLGEELLNWDFLVFTGIDFNIPPDDIGGGERVSPPRTFSLLQNYPNPFNPHTRIPFEVPQGSGLVNLAVYDSRGRHATTLLSARLAAGEHEIMWDGRDHFGRHVRSGVFFYRLTVDGESFTRRMRLLR